MYLIHLGFSIFFNNNIFSGDVRILFSEWGSLGRTFQGGLHTNSILGPEDEDALVSSSRDWGILKNKWKSSFSVVLINCCALFLCIND
jgi:hypothetical protein